MTIRERLQALLDGKAIYSSFIRPHRLADKGFEFLSPLEHWLHTNNLNDLLNPDTKVDIYEEPKPEPAQEKRKEFRHKYFSACLTVEQADAIADYIDEEKCIERDKEIAVEQYKLYVEMADKISERRTHANNFFVTLNSSLITVYGIATTKESIIQGGPWLWLVPIAGIAICLLWREIVRSYRDINSAKFKVIHEIEDCLPLALYRHEWEIAKQGDGTKYRPTSHIEMWVPWVFGALYVIIAAVQFLPVVCALAP